jgi:hypothetical protein
MCLLAIRDAWRKVPGVDHGEETAPAAISVRNQS